mmetsp:Transcript_2163/g.3683  ORF Transcript_2163/g.3683 Transcript_2163/m.3683 type:complete len:85 (-) Transcript_2163:145-399(-)
MLQLMQSCVPDEPAAPLLLALVKNSAMGVTVKLRVGTGTLPPTARRTDEPPQSTPARREDRCGFGDDVLCGFVSAYCMASAAVD